MHTTLVREPLLFSSPVSFACSMFDSQHRPVRHEAIVCYSYLPSAVALSHLATLHSSDILATYQKYWN